MANSISKSMTNSNFSVRDLTQIGLFAALTGVLAFISVPLPFSPVPVSGQTLGVMLAGVLLGSRKGALSQVVYVILGSIGLPIFSGGTSGIGVLFGPTGGYIWGFIIGAYIIGKIIEIKEEPGIIWKAAALITGGILVIYLTGVLQLMLAAKMSLAKAITAGVLPFIPGGIFKIIVTLLISQRGIKRLLLL
ncbi:MAG: biotin transporter BioY [Halanaerobiaceae bacterium]